jgi:hypothetical protein
MWININDSNVFIEQMNEYYCMYIFDLLKKIIIENNLTVNIILGNINIPNINSNKLIRIKINYEHTLVKVGGRDSHCAIPGKIKDNLGNNYLVRIDQFHNLNYSDIVVDYSIPNMQNILQSGKYNEFYRKIIYIAPCIYEKKFTADNNRKIKTLTTFINTNEPRRNKLLKDLEKNGFDHINVNNCFEKDNLQKLYHDTKIIINIHQTDHHHTLEELRILPALLCGVIVISENSPLTDCVPYSDYIIWSSYDNIISTTKNVLDNYDKYYNEIFNNPNKTKLELLDKENYINMKNRVSNLLSSP